MRELGRSIPCVELADEANNIVMDEFPLVSRHKEFCEFFLVVMSVSCITDMGT